MNNRIVDVLFPSPLLPTRSHEHFTRFRSAVFAIVLTLAGHSQASAAAVTLQWDPPTDTTTTGYVVWYGNAVGNYTAWTDVGYVTTRKIEGLADDTPYCFAVKAYSANGETSDFSSAVCTRTAKPSTGGGTPPPDDGTTTPPAETGNGSEIVLYAANATPTSGHWTKAGSSGAAGGTAMRSANNGWQRASAPLASPTHFFELPFEAIANTPYRIWLRLRAGADSKWNDSVWVQLSNALVNGSPAYRIGTTSGLAVNLERCNACGVSGWGWLNSAYWLNQSTVVKFANSGPQTIRIQTREDGVEIDQVVLSSARYMSAAPGAALNDATLLPQTIVALPAASTPYGSSPISLPGTIPAAYFDKGAAGVAYADSTAGNTGGVFRATDVDLQNASVGGYNIAWTAAGEWVNYSVNVATAGSYTMKVRVASVGGGSLHVTAGAPSALSKTIAIPNTGGWQSWTYVNVPVTLAAGKQVVTVKFVTATVNLRSVGFVK